MPDVTTVETGVIWVVTGWFLAVLAAGCTFGAHHHRINATVDQPDHSAGVSGTVDGVDLGVVADFRYLRVGLPYEGQRHQIDVDLEEGGRFEVDNVFELRTLRVDVPVWSLRDFSKEPSGHWYPGAMKQRESLELWLSGSVGVTPISPATASVGLTYYRYGGFSARLYGGVAFNPYSGLTTTDAGQTEQLVRREGRAPGAVVGLEVTLAAGEYALELAQFILDLDRDSRDGIGPR